MKPAKQTNWDLALRLRRCSELESLAANTALLTSAAARVTRERLFYTPFRFVTFGPNAEEDQAASVSVGESDAECPMELPPNG
jgi:hypothetical protein